mgnify:CR=1 FL=1
MTRTERFKRAFKILKSAGHTQVTVAVDLLGLSGQPRVSEYLRGHIQPSEPITRHIELEAGLRTPHLSPALAARES